MVQIQDVVVSLDVFRGKFLCDLDACKGACCVEGDAGAPVTLDEILELEQILPEIWDDLCPEAREVIDSQGVAYADPEGEMVTSIVKGKDCVFTLRDSYGHCLCAIEKAYREGRCGFMKPISCRLYPLRVADFGDIRAVNYHRWEICKSAVLAGKKHDMPLYRFLKEPLIERFGQDWYDEMLTVATELVKQKII